MRVQWYRSLLRAPWMAALALSLVSLTARAADPVPEFRQDRVSVAPRVKGDFSALRSFVGGFESDAGAQYSVCIVRFSDPHNRGGKRSATTVEYVDKVFEAWRDELDAERHILVALSTENRGIAIHSGSTWAALGFEQRAITQVIDRSSFAPTARAGNVPLALERLIRAVDLHLSIQVANEKQRAEKVRAGLERAPDRIAALEQDFGTRTFDTTTVDASVEEARKLLREATATLDAGEVAAAARLLDGHHRALNAARRELMRLDAQQEELDRLRKIAPAALRTVRAEFESVHERLSAAPYDAEELLEDAAGIVVSLDEADQTLAAGDPVKAARLAENLHRWVAGLARADSEGRAAHQRTLERLETARGRSSEIADLIADRKRGLDGVPYEAAALQAILETARDARKEGDAAVAAGDPEAGLTAFSAAELRVARLDSAQAEAESDHHFTTVVLPLGLAAAGGLFLLLLLLFHWRTRRARRKTAVGRIVRWERMLGRAGTRLVKIRDDHPHLFGSRRLFWRYEGETAEVYKEVGEQVDDLFLSYGTANLQLTLAKEKLSGAGPVGWAAFEHAAILLEDAKVEVRREAVGDLQLFLPETRVITRRADELLEHMGEVYEAVYAAVDDLEDRVQVAPRTLEEVVHLCAANEEALANIGQAGLYPDPFEGDLEALVERQKRLVASAQADPIGCTEPAAALRVDATALRERLGRVEEASRLLRDVRDPRLPATLAEIARLRREGLRLDEPGFEPDAMLAAARAAASAVQTSVAAGADEEALASANRAVSTLTELDDLIARTVRSRDETPGNLVGLRDEERRLRDRLPERRERLGALAGLHAEDALQPALDNAEEALAALDFCVRCMDEAQAAIAPDSQRFLAGAEIARRALDVLRSVAALYEEIETKSGELDQARRDAEEALAALQTLLLDVDQLPDHDAFASVATLEGVEDLRAGARSLRSLVEDAVPHWPRARADGQDLLDAGRATFERAREERDAFVAATAIQDDAERDFQRVAHSLGSSEDDRVAANQWLESARTLLAEIAAEQAQEHPDWPALLALLEDVRVETGEAERLALGDFAAADAAREAVAAARTAVAHANVVYGWGIKARLGKGKRTLAAAEWKLGLRQYEAALADAEEARSLSESARRTALRNVRVAQAAAGLAARRARRLRRERRLNAFFAGTGSFLGVTRGSGDSSSSSFGSSFGSSSGGSSFGGFSGGSSFGSSSGGSSFGGSSSGGSGW